MKKTTGKVVSLVLALALVVTSFSATFAFAATKSETATVTLKDSTVYLSNGGSAATLTADVFTKLAPDTATLYDHTDVKTAPLAIKDVVLTGGSNIATLATTVVNGAVTKAEITLKNKDVKGDITLSARYSGTDATGETVYNGISTLKVTVLASGLTVIGALANKSAAPADADVAVGAYPTALSTLAKTDKNAIYGAVYTVAPGTDAFAKWSAVTTPIKTTVDTTLADAIGSYVVTTSGNTTVTATADATNKSIITLTAAKAASASAAAPYAAIGNVAVKAVKVVADDTKQKLSTVALDTAFATTKVENKVVATSAQDTIYVYRGATYLGTDSADSAVANTPEAILVTGANIDASAVPALTMQDGTVGTITGDKTLTTNKITVQKGIVAAIGGVADVTVTSGNIGKITDAVTKAVVNGGKVGDIAGGAVTVTSTDETVATVVGAITATTATIGQSEKAAVATGIVTSPAINVYGSKTTVAGMNSDYAAAFTLSYIGYVGAGAVPANILTRTTPTISISVDADSTISYNNAVTLPALTVYGTVKFASNAKVAGITGSGTGTVEFVAGKFYSTGSLSGIKMKAAGTFKVGDTLFSADAYQVYPGSFTSVGYTTDVVSTDKVDTFKVKSVDFYSITLNKTTDKILVGKKATYTASAYPAGTKLPDGATIKFTFDGNSDNFTFTDNGNGTATVEAKKYESVFSSLNAGTLTAKLYDAYGFELSQYEAATAAITVVNKLDVVSDTNADFSVAFGSTYQFKLTASTAPSFYAGTDGIFKVALASHTGNDYFYKITATGKVGSATGIYVNGNKLLVATVKNAPYTSDTKGNVTVKGAYTVKITAAAVPTFGVGTAGVFSAKFVSKTGNDYLYKISSVGKVGTQAGIYVNGVKTFVGIVG